MLVRYYFGILWFLMFALGSHDCFAQKSEKVDEAIQKRKVKSSYSLEPEADERDTEVGLDLDEGIFLGYGAISAFSTKMMGGYVGGIGVRGAWVINEKLGLGLDFAINTTPLSPYDEKSDPVLKHAKLDYMHWGIDFEYFPDSHKIFHPVYSLIVGRAFAQLHENDFDYYSDPEYEANRKYFGGLAMYFVQPEAAIEFNATKYTRISAGLGLRLVVAGKGKTNLNESEFTQLVAQLIFKFGNFRY